LWCVNQGAALTLALSRGGEGTDRVDHPNYVDLKVRAELKSEKPTNQTTQG